jgi:toxin FitB
MKIVRGECVGSVKVMSTADGKATQRWAVDTSVSVPRVHAGHSHHSIVKEAIGERKVHLSGHALAETYAVLTRLPNVQLTARQVAELIDDDFLVPLVLSPQTFIQAHQEFSKLGITGGAVYDGLVGLAARESGATLLTMDTRASATYDALGVKTEMIAVT